MPSATTARIVAYRSEHQPAFQALNEEWITHYFQLEETDHRQSRAPQQHILDPGGHIFMALLEDEPVGACALLYETSTSYELAKMAVSPHARGLGIGRLLGEAAIAQARALGAQHLELLSNRRLTTALALYRRLGFVEAPLAPTAYQRADIRMVLNL
ncbi:GNAT family N-acetyltransferase [Hymenobacter pini]|uniref:GNAT family N-acetyltransferase n=1 Tax=Hymenobacter pini TaxID=2880879 RepID=UPI001CF277FA|nr:GNAT family N-acetyltransferase [Hymenobacter pini]MCA8832972.1 GNAT family N-acetyltransferase [Hymenobacter pini]